MAFNIHHPNPAAGDNYQSNVALAQRIEAVGMKVAPGGWKQNWDGSWSIGQRFTDFGDDLSVAAKFELWKGQQPIPLVQGDDGILQIAKGAILPDGHVWPTGPAAPEPKFLDGLKKSVEDMIAKAFATPVEPEPEPQPEPESVMARLLSFGITKEI
jgi:hypothetical protein